MTNCIIISGKLRNKSFAYFHQRYVKSILYDAYYHRESRRTSFDCQTFTRSIYYVVVCFLSVAYVQAENSTYSMQKLFANTSYRSYFGSSVSINKEYALIGARGGTQGHSYIFKRTNTSNTSYTWLPIATLDDPEGHDPEANGFGFSVSMYNEYALIGTPWADDHDSGPDSGVAYIFQRMNTSWIQSAKLFPDYENYRYTGDHFGYSVSIYDRYALIGAPDDDYIADASGSAYIFQRNGGVWQQTTKIHPDDAEALDFFGYSVSIYDRYALIGAYKHLVNGTECGAAYIFELETQSSSWVQTARLVADDRDSNDYFGSSVSVYGEHALIGAYGKGDTKGAAYIFEKLVNGSWIQVAKLIANDAKSNTRFGRSVSIYGQYALIGSRDTNYGPGSAYIFAHQSDGWLQTATLSPYDGYNGQYFGHSVSMYNGFALIGTSDMQSVGAAYVFTNYASCDKIWNETVNKHILVNTNSNYLIDYRWTPCVFAFDSSIGPTIEPTINPTINPTMYPTSNPTIDPTINPTIDPTINPTVNPTIYPTMNPTMDPTTDPTINPTINPTANLTIDPTINPTYVPTNVPTMESTKYPKHTTDTTKDRISTISVIHPDVTKSKGIEKGIMITESTLQIIIAAIVIGGIVLVFVIVISCCCVCYKKKRNDEIGERGDMELEISDNDNNGNNDNSAAEHSVVPPGIGHLSMSLLKYQSVDRDEDNRDEQNALEEKEGADDNEGVPNAYGVRRNGEENPDDLYDAPVATNIHYEEHQALIDWLQSKGLKHCVIHFVSNGYESLDYVKDITNVQDLIDIGIKSKADQDKLMRLIKFELNSNQPEKRDTVEMHIMQTPK
eukprot:67261_1